MGTRKNSKTHIFIWRIFFSKEQIEKEILSNDIVASKFCKDPNKQNLSEKLCREVLKIQQMPPSGKNSIRFNRSGDIVNSFSLDTTKSVDFIYKGYYCTQKYTKDCGGLQDSQRNEVVQFLEKGSIKHKVMAIVDGGYWEQQTPKLKEKFKENSNVIITSVTELTGGKNE